MLDEQAGGACIVHEGGDVQGRAEIGLTRQVARGGDEAGSGRPVAGQDALLQFLRTGGVRQDQRQKRHGTKNRSTHGHQFRGFQNPSIAGSKCEAPRWLTARETGALCMPGKKSGRDMIGVARAAAAGLLGLAGPAVAEEPVDIELALAVDVSISVDGTELALQRQGLSAAFRDPAIIDAIAGNAAGVAVMVMLWAGADQQLVAVDWRHLTDATSSRAFADEIDRALAVDPELQGKTAIGNALHVAMGAIRDNAYLGARRKIDLSGDGHANEGFKPDRVRDYAVLSGITVSGLAILNDEPYLEQYYREHVIGGPGAFVMTAADYRDFVEAIRRKLLRELSPVEISGQPGRIVAAR
ncbi:MAG: DUF1194 domain-containing protein [Geminicoccaceae bacterium]